MDAQMGAGVEVLATPAELADTVARRLVQRLAEIQASGRVPNVVLTGGTIAGAIHAAVPTTPGADAVDWGAAEFWFGDERYVDRDSPDRNARQARELMLDQLPGVGPRVHEMPWDDGTPVEEAAAAYSAEVRASSADRFDIVMLGMGPDGHVASLFPGFPQLDDTDAVAIAVHDSPKPPPTRISLTYPALAHTHATWLLVTGSGKAAAAARALGGADYHEIPAARVTAPELVWFLDEEAAALLDR
ncbi:MAG: 6-phosphogluconolactonase [Nocardioidaceae bacterium]